MIETGTFAIVKKVFSDTDNSVICAFLSGKSDDVFRYNFPVHQRSIIGWRLNHHAVRAYINRNGDSQEMITAQQSAFYLVAAGRVADLKTIIKQGQLDEMVHYINFNMGLIINHIER